MNDSCADRSELHFPLNPDKYFDLIYLKVSKSETWRCLRSVTKSTRWLMERRSSSWPKLPEKFYFFIFVDCFLSGIFMCNRFNTLTMSEIRIFLFISVTEADLKVYVKAAGRSACRDTCWTHTHRGCQCVWQQLSWGLMGRWWWWWWGLWDCGRCIGGSGVPPGSRRCL